MSMNSSSPTAGRTTICKLVCSDIGIARSARFLSCGHGRGVRSCLAQGRYAKSLTVELQHVFRLPLLGLFA